MLMPAGTGMLPAGSLPGSQHLFPVRRGAQRLAPAPSPPPLRDAIDLSGTGLSTEAGIIKALIEKTFGVKGQEACALPSPDAVRELADLRSGDQVALTKLEGMGMTIINAQATQITLRAQWEGGEVEIQATRISVEIISIRAVNMQEQDPLVLDIDGDGLDLRPAEEGVAFDIDGDGQVEKTGFVRGDDALLIYDRNGDGKIGGRDLLGDHHGAANGFEELRRFDDNADGRIDRADAIYSKLRAYQDLNGDGLMQRGEFRTLEDVGVAAIELAYEEGHGVSGGQRIAEVGAFERTDGTIGMAADVMLKYQEIGSA